VLLRKALSGENGISSPRKVGGGETVLGDYVNTASKGIESALTSWNSLGGGDASYVKNLR